MGNSNQRNIAHAEARDILGPESWAWLKKQFEKYNVKQFGLDFFEQLLRNRFERMPKPLIEALYKAFAGDLNRKLNSDDFIVNLAVLKGLDRAAKLKFLFKIYDTQSNGKLDRIKFASLLQLAYDSSAFLRHSELKKQFEGIFPNEREITTLKEFEQYTGGLELLEGWVQEVISAIIAPPATKIMLLEHKYSPTIEKGEIMRKFGISETVTTQLRSIFVSKCGSGPRSEMSLACWMDLTRGFLSVPLACAIFCGRMKSFKPVWRFSEFAEFCVICSGHGGGGVPGGAIQALAEYIAAVFQHESLAILRHAAARRGAADRLRNTKSGMNTVAGASLRDTPSASGSSNSGKESSAATINATTQNTASNNNTTADPSSTSATNNLSNSPTSTAVAAAEEQANKQHMRRMIRLLRFPEAAATISVIFDEEEMAGRLSMLQSPGTVYESRVSFAFSDHDIHGASSPPSGTGNNSNANSAVGAPPQTMVSPRGTSASRLSNVGSPRSGTITESRRVLASRFSDYQRPDLQSTSAATVNVSASSAPSANGLNGSGGKSANSTVNNSAGGSNGLPYAWDIFAVKETMMEPALVNALANIEAFPGTLAATTNTTTTGKSGTNSIANNSITTTSNSIATTENLSGNSSDTAPLSRYARILEAYADILPAVRQLELVACCLFGMRPSTPVKEQAAIMELFIRRDAELPWKATQPYGQVDTEWCILAKPWYDSWRLFVGGLNSPTSDIHTSHTKTSRFGGNSGPSDPGPIDNLTIIQQKNEAKPLLNGCVIGQQLEIVPPIIYNCFENWYRGGPKLIRKVAQTETGGLELELYPIYLRVVFCDNKGRQTDQVSEQLFSRHALVRDVTRELCESGGVDVSRGKLWNYAVAVPNEQHPVPVDLTVTRAALQDGQLVLLEICTEEGLWPRSALQSAATARLNNAVDSRVSSPMPFMSKGDGSEEDNISSRLNSGRIGLDNVGNTCYMNASLQALAHTTPLVEYFLRQYYGKHVNTVSKFGYQGRLAQSFARLLVDLWTTGQSAVSPRRFHTDFTLLAAQFRGHDQHDAQEFLAFALDGISEDLNLVQSKPYIENPDSDGRPDSQLAELWWNNHKQREHSVVQALFAGQFKSVMTCKCGQYSSARFESFTFLTLPVPEDVERRLTVYVVSTVGTHAVSCAIRVPKDSDLTAVIRKVWALNLPGIDNPITNNNIPNLPAGVNPVDSAFMIAHVASSLVISVCSPDRKVDTLRDSDNIFLYHLRVPPPPSSLVVAAVGASNAVSSQKDSGRSVSNAAAPASARSSISSALPGSAAATPRKSGTSKAIASLMTNFERSVSTMSDDSKPNVSPDGIATMSNNNGTLDTKPATGLSSRQSVHAGPPVLSLATQQVNLLRQSPRNAVNNQVNSPRGLTPRSATIAAAAASLIGVESNARTLSGVGAANVSQMLNNLLKCTINGKIYRKQVFIHRRVRLTDGGGVELYRMESFGLPFALLVPETPGSMSGAELYDLVARRVRPLLRVPTISSSVASSPVNTMNSNGTTNTASASIPAGSWNSIPLELPAYIFKPSQYALPANNINNNNNNSTASSSSQTGINNNSNNGNNGIYSYNTADPTSGIQRVVPDEILGGTIARYGFSLRTVLAGGLIGGGGVCSRCPWLQGCSGCLLPDTNEMCCGAEMPLALLDEEVLAVDWHYAAYEETVDQALASDIRPHPSVEAEAEIASRQIVPFSKCLDKFTEEEGLEGVTCPRCLDDSRMMKELRIWRGPPILIVQLKRFHFDRFAKRKLLDKVDFPLNGFDLGPYCAPSKRAELLSTGLDSSCTYDLYAVVHHVGRMGEGHYVATVLSDVEPSEDSANGNGSDSTTPGTSPTKNINNIGNGNGNANGSNGRAQEWLCYNDNAVSVMDASEVSCAPSAYVLFYIRRDIKNSSIEQLFDVTQINASAPAASSSLYANNNNTSSNGNMNNSSGVGATLAKLGGNILTASSQRERSMPRRPFPGVGTGRGSMRVTPHSGIKEASANTPGTAATSGNSTPSKDTSNVYGIENHSSDSQQEKRDSVELLDPNNLNSASTDSLSGLRLPAPRSRGQNTPLQNKESLRNSGTFVKPLQLEVSNSISNGNAGLSTSANGRDSPVLGLGPQTSGSSLGGSATPGRVAGNPGNINANAIQQLGASSPRTVDLSQPVGSSNVNRNLSATNLNENRRGSTGNMKNNNNNGMPNGSASVLVQNSPDKGANCIVQ